MVSCFLNQISQIVSPEFRSCHSCFQDLKATVADLKHIEESAKQQIENLSKRLQEEKEFCALNREALRAELEACKVWPAKTKTRMLGSIGSCLSTAGYKHPEMSKTAKSKKKKIEASFFFLPKLPRKLFLGRVRL